MFQSLLIVLLVGLAPGSSGSSKCYHCFVIGDSNLLEACGGNTNITVVQRFEDLQSALAVIPLLEEDFLSLPDGVRNCVHVDVPAGHHVISAPVDMRNASVELAGPAGAVSSPPKVHCNYTSVGVNFTLNFIGSEYVSFRHVDFLGCPYPLRLARVRTVTVHNGTFQ